MTSSTNTRLPAVEGPIAGGKRMMLAGTAFDLGAHGYSEAEYFLSGTARAYEPSDDGAVPTESADYRTRIVMYRPTDAAAFNGTVVVEWFNVSGGLDGAPDWTFLHRELMREGYAYVGVSAQAVGVIGGDSMMALSGMSLVESDPERYGSLVHPGDRFSFDMFTQAGAVARTPTGTILDDLHVERVIAIGESQSAFCLTTYVNHIDPITEAFDGYLVHARGGGAMPLDTDGTRIAGREGTVLFRDDLRVPVLCFEAETDVITLGYHRARQPDTDHLCVWEVAGLAHADVYTFVAGFGDSGTVPIEDLAASWQPTDTLYGSKLEHAVNVGPQHYVLQAAMRHLERWLRDGTRPPTAPRLDTTGDDNAVSLVVDDLGIATGGIRTPHVDVPVHVLTGVGNSGGPFAVLAGCTIPFTPEQLARLYPTRDEYLRAFRASTDATVAARFFLAEDADEIIAIAELNYPG